MQTRPDEAEREPLVKEIPPKAADLPEWYQAVVYKAELVSLAPVRGCVVLRPYGYAIWERLVAELDARFKATGHENAYFPLLIPESLLQREQDHVEGFVPEVAWVTQGGGETLAERLAIRPTSEVTIMTMFAKWVHSYRDLPLLINQWANVLRWEKRTRPFLRTLEFLWQEGHTAHASAKEAAEEAARMLDVYKDVAENVAAIPVYAGEKSESERFPGAVHTYSIEALMPDGRALQAGTSHEFGQNFARAYGIEFAAEDGSLQYAWTTSWGMSWRMIGATIMVHGDDRGLRFPPRLAPLEVVIVPILQGDGGDVRAAAQRLHDAIRDAGHRVRLDVRDQSPGWKFNEWEMRGVPVRIELGPRDLAQGVATLVRRDRAFREEGQKTTVPLTHVPARLKDVLEAIQAGLFEQAKAFLRSHTFTAGDSTELFARLRERAGMADVPWCARPECEAHVKAETSATTRNVRTPAKGPACAACGEPAKVQAYFAQAY
jgi:prolyl-tRNA synthetase